MADGAAVRELKETIAALRKENAAYKAASAPNAVAVVPHGASFESADDEPLLRVAMRRTTSLAFFLVCLSVTAIILEGYELTLAREVELSFFVPFLIGHGGNAGGGTVGAIISTLAKGGAATREARLKLVSREAGCAAIVGLVLAALGAAILPHLVARHTALIVLLTLPAITAIAGVVGSVLPLAFHAAGLDAATLAPPAVTTLIDALGLVAYLSIANAVLKARDAPV